MTRPAHPKKEGAAHADARRRAPVEVEVTGSPAAPSPAPSAPGHPNSDPLAAWLDRAESLHARPDHAASHHHPLPESVRILAARFALTRVEVDILSLAMLAELRPHTPRPLDFGAIVTALGADAWAALAAHAPLRRWKLLEVGPGERLTDAPARIDERLLMHILGVATMDDALRPLISPITPGIPPAATRPRDAEPAARLARAWSESHPSTPDALHPDPEPVLVVGGSPARRRRVAASAITSLGLHPWLMTAGDVPPSAPDRERVARHIERETALSGLGLVLDAGDHPSHAHDLASRLGSPCIVCCESADPAARYAVRLDAEGDAADLDEWRLAFPDLDPAPLAALRAEFRLTPEELAAVRASLPGAPRAQDADARQPRTPAAASAPDHSPRRDAFIAVATARLERVAPCLVPRASLDRLVLPPAQRKLIDDLVRRVKWRGRVLDDWGYRAVSSSRGVTAMLTGASGTGKSFAAEALAHELGLRLCRIDLASVVSKYIGETEKQLSRIFDAAEAGGAVLLFDEADALFGKRTELRDSHDRYANIEVAYLLQRLERSGIVVLTTNLKHNVDPAFLRRLDVVIDFPFPTADARRRLWELSLPPQAPRHDLDLDKLAQLHASGGAIRNIALSAAYLAGERGAPITMHDMLEAARLEALKQERSLSDRETRGWTP